MDDRFKLGADMIRWPLSFLLLMALPLLGLLAAGREIAPYLEIPPQTRYVTPAGFSWGWFVFFAVIDLLLVGVLAGAVTCGRRRWRESMGEPTAAGPRIDYRLRRGGVKQPIGPPGAGTSAGAAGRPNPGRFPWWGWAGLVLCLASWFMAWQRFAWFRLFQPHTFLPIWLGFILLVNALTVQRSGSCLILRRPRGFLMLFPASAAFWWLFEYLNRFVQNWYYTGIEGLGPGAYSGFSSLAFATVLPGVLSVMALLHTFPTLSKGLARCRPIDLPASPWIAVATLAAAASGLALIGIFPDQLFALLWVAPLLIALSIQRLSGQPTALASLQRGDWRPLVVPALAALTCGFFWEMWNSFSLARWTYTIPFVQRFHLFEMPILGYGGYLPFGLQCLVAGTVVIGDPFGPGRKETLAAV